jgi:GNAT superfamily N-acetyltransferase
VVKELQIRPAVGDDLTVLRDIEWASGQRYREHGLDHVADDEPASLEVLARYADDGRAWVAVDDPGQPVGYILVDIIDGGGHIEQVSVAPDHQGQGIGRALVEHVESWAISKGFTALTLTTFGHIPWNRPLYEHLGFRVLSQDEISPGVQAVRDAEADHGLDPDLRVVMQLKV